MAYKIPSNIMRKIKDRSPSYPGPDNEGERDNDECSTGYKSICIYVQNGLENKSDLLLGISRAIFDIQSNNTRMYPLLVFGFGDSKTLQHEGKYFDFGYLNDYLYGPNIAQAMARVSGAKRVAPAIIPELFPRVDIRSLYGGKINIEREDLLIIVGHKGEVYFNETLRGLRASLFKQILFVEICNEDIQCYFGKFTFEYRSLA